MKGDNTHQFLVMATAHMTIGQMSSTELDNKSK
jgi:hypothetical protein